MPALVFRHAHRVTYTECTMGNHVYHARYLDLLEAARGEFLRHLGTTFREWQERDVIFPIVECRLSYKAPARYDDLLSIEVRLTAAFGARLNFGFRIVNQQDRLILEAATLHVCAGLNEKPKRLPEELLEKLRPHLDEKKK
jgi:acyl-CoA thioester hydrolase